MSDKTILHMLTPLKHMSPFDVNMAADAGFDVLSSYTNVTASEVAGLVQDAIFSRPPKRGVKTGLFIGGKDAIVALDMLKAAKKAFVPPFAISLFADPAGSFTTAAAMVARVERLLRVQYDRGLKGAKVLVFGATGVVGFSSAVIAALEGADVTLVGYDGPVRVERLSAEIEARFDVTTRFADGSDDEKKEKLLLGAEIVLSAGKAGVQVLSADLVRSADSLLIAADVNAVPPAGIEGLAPTANGEKIGNSKALGLGALTIGGVKYQTQSGLFKQMLKAEKPVVYDFRDAFVLARTLVQ
ncbi:NAD(P)-dependent methylenetetrahydromethanopterin dehydrogenase [Rhodoligotrophos defluvii]|uniref:NAD(P)-dependent methylenetetrahydromethanopterin dehydrogenase n=1 Tax=Rhodoligotrophos defluvii TaxID=2561934 RepID=UPI0010C9C9A8|nr:NAD(P)-dependent methylenetetrahydromethanopterin dehydrogenase [Rhodoligotrophos defluvii]